MILDRYSLDEAIDEEIVLALTQVPQNPLTGTLLRVTRSPDEEPTRLHLLTGDHEWSVSWSQISMAWTEE